MRSESIELLMNTSIDRFGKKSVVYSEVAPDHNHGIYFDIKGSSASFCVHAREGTLPLGFYEIKIENEPFDDYNYAAIVSLEELLEIVDQMCASLKH